MDPQQQPQQPMVDRSKTAAAAEQRADAEQRRGAPSDAGSGLPAGLVGRAAPEASGVGGLGTTGTGGGNPAAARRDNIGGGADVTDITRLARDMS
ncbi:hypothetical protein HYH03_016778 [Edaphochlamys debaryana]|uniref:Uncharacterized protein n=1 Tax=Edaphochlamys debaryana TaxID=47281 RepID=A0A836BR27_9CHLO|nr:hypothetical protein HYH03_016778 [Edaphochlamys debaryana]|eukprot:KAG2484359.1 hypothetical protein HYH03_016778 [Edaphochlamys debaryana]